MLGSRSALALPALRHRPDIRQAIPDERTLHSLRLLKFKREQGYFIGAIYINYAPPSPSRFPASSSSTPSPIAPSTNNSALGASCRILPAMFFHHLQKPVVDVRSLLQSGKAALQRAAEEKKRRVITSVVRRRHWDDFVTAREIHSGERRPQFWQAKMIMALAMGNRFNFFSEARPWKLRSHHARAHQPGAAGPAQRSSVDRTP